MTSLSVNVNKLATLRNSRGKNNPDVVKSALDLVSFGAQGITIHPRPDERHIRRSDVSALKKAITSVELNIEGYPSEDFVRMVEETGPAQATLVPDPPEALTSNAGWTLREGASILSRVCPRLHARGIRVSVFVDPETMGDGDYVQLRNWQVDRVELYTERYAEHFALSDREAVLAGYRAAAEKARAAGLGVNAGHDLNLDNLARLIEAIPWIDEVSIGHALICDALYLGFEETIRRYLDCIRRGGGR